MQSIGNEEPQLPETIYSNYWILLQDNIKFLEYAWNESGVVLNVCIILHAENDADDSFLLSRQVSSTDSHVSEWRNTIELGGFHQIN